jgi:hypothetical protein
MTNEPTDETGTSDATTGRRAPLLAAVVGALAIVAVLVVLVANRDDQDDAADGATTTAASSEGSPSSTPGPAPDDPDLSIPMGQIQGTTPAEICAGVVARLEEYRSITASQPAPAPIVVDNLAQFTDEIFTLADQQVWGDRMIEELTTVRREWANAASALGAEDAEDAEAAEAAGAAAQDALTRAIDGADCPVG